MDNGVTQFRFLQVADSNAGYFYVWRSSKNSELSSNFTYDDKGRLTVMSQGARSAALVYDSKGQISSLKNPLGQETPSTYDEARRIKAVTLANGKTLDYSYDALGEAASLRGCLDSLFGCYNGHEATL